MAASRNCLEWLELEDEDDDDDDSTDAAWDTRIETTGEPTTKKRPRRLRPDTLEPVPSTPPKSAIPSCFMSWMIQWLTATPPSPFLLETLSPVSVTAVPNGSKRDTTTVGSCCSTAASSVAEDGETVTKQSRIQPKLIHTVVTANQNTENRREKFVQRGNAQDYDYREYLTTKYRS